MKLLHVVFVLFAAPAMSDEWSIVSVDGTDAVENPTIRFDEGGAISGSTGCNRFSGMATAQDGTLVFTEALAMTRMACPETALNAQEQRLLALMSGTVTLQPDPFAGTLTLVRGGATARLAPMTTNKETPRPAEHLMVTGVDAHLNIRTEASTKSAIVARAPLGSILNNLGCEERPDRTWCEIAFVDDSGVEGWAASEYLEPVTGLRRASAEIFDQIGRLDCKPSGATTFQKCDFGVARGGPSEGAMMVYLPGDHRILLDYQAGRLVVSDGETEVDAEVQVIDTGLRVTVSHSIIEMPLAPFLSEYRKAVFHFSFLTRIVHRLLVCPAPARSAYSRSCALAPQHDELSTRANFLANCAIY